MPARGRVAVVANQNRQPLPIAFGDGDGNSDSGDPAAAAARAARAARIKEKLDRARELVAQRDEPIAVVEMDSDPDDDGAVVRELTAVREIYCYGDTFAARNGLMLDVVRPEDLTWRLTWHAGRVSQDGRSRTAGSWTFVWLIRSVCHVSDDDADGGNGFSAWSGCSRIPRWPTAQLARAWAADREMPYVDDLKIEQAEVVNAAADTVVNDDRPLPDEPACIWLTSESPV